MKKFIFTISIIFLKIGFSDFVHADPQAEFYFLNKYGDTLYVRFFPTSSVFCGKDGLNPFTKLSLLAKGVDPNNNSGRARRNGGNRLKYLVGLDGYALSHYNHPRSDSLYFRVDPGTEFTPNKWMLLGSDAGANDDLDGLFGFGEYLFQIFRTTNQGISFIKICEIPLDYLDFNYPMMWKQLEEESI